MDLNKRRFPTKFAAVILRTAAVLLPLAVAQGTAKAQCAAELPVGYKLMDIAGRKVAVWYPSAVPDSRYQYPGRAGVVGSVALNAAPNECGRFPLLAFSHGVNGCATQSIFLTESLARRGYVVAAPDHADATCSADGSRSGNEATSLSEFRDPETWTDQKYADRKNDIQALITALVSDAVLGRVINAEAIGGVGHSLGGYTIMGMAGGWPSWKDRRLRAVALLSPFADPFMVSGRSPQIDIPVMYQGGTTDLLITPSLERPNGAYDRSPPPKFLSKYTGGHLLWTNVSCMNMPVAQCVNSPGDAQAVTEDITAFLDRYLKGRETPNLFQPRLSASRVGYRRNSATASASAASFARIPVAPESWVSLFSEGLTERVIVAPSLPLPETLAGISVLITDARRQVLRAPIYFISPSQINFVVPAGAAPGPASIDVRSGDQSIASGALEIASAAPAFFSANRSGNGAPAGEYIAVAPDGTRTGGVLATGDGTPVPLNVTNAQVYIVLYGTGIRSVAPGRITATIADQPVPVLAVAASPEYPGLDQLSIGPLPASLAGTGAVDVKVSVDGQLANVLRVSIR